MDAPGTLGPKARVGNAVPPLPAWETSLKRSGPSLAHRTESAYCGSGAGGRTGRRQAEGVKKPWRVFPGWEERKSLSVSTASQGSPHWPKLEVKDI